jgi:hypothetical protein
MKEGTIRSRKDAEKLIGKMPLLNVKGYPRLEKALMEALGFEHDPKLQEFKWELNEIMGIMGISRRTYKGTGESMHFTPGEAIFIREDAEEVFEEIRKERKLGKDMSVRDAAWVLTYLLVRGRYPHLLPRLACIPVGNIKELRRLFCSFYRKYKPEFMHLAETDTKYETYDFSLLLWSLFAIRKGYWLSISYDLHPGADASVQYNESLMKQAHEFSELADRAAHRAAAYAIKNRLKKADYLFIVSLFFQGCLEAADARHKVFMPKSTMEWIAYGIPKQSFYRRLDDLKKDSPNDARVVGVVMKTLPRIWENQRKSPPLITRINPPEEEP